LYQKILVPVDGSEHSNRALHEAISIAKMTDGTITLIHVIPAGSSVLMSSKEQFYEMQQNKGKAVLADGKKLVEANGVLAGTLLLEGDVVGQIIKTTKEGNFDLIVIGARGLSKLEELMMGSVSHGVAENASCPVVVTK
jgi:nucleotide-binding universal stress UspA family protein